MQIHFGAGPKLCLFHPGGGYPLYPSVPENHRSVPFWHPFLLPVYIIGVHGTQLGVVYLKTAVVYLSGIHFHCWCAIVSVHGFWLGAVY